MHKIAVIGLGYVGLPLARLFSTKYETVGYDINRNRVDELNKGIDKTNEVDNTLLFNAISSKALKCTTDIEDIKDCNIYIVTVPTPVNDKFQPDLSPLIGASKLVGSVISKGDIVVYESTTFPTCTETVCIPVVEKTSGLKYNVDFFAGYSPERINPGDKEHTVEKIRKVTSGSTPEVADIVDNLYNSVLTNGTFKASSMRVAEASKIIENTQRDINIAFFNELSKLFSKLNIDTNDVIEAASTKWNFISLKPGLVGGHCISVDPYYLIQLADEYGVDTPLITNGRKVNERMSEYVVDKIISNMNKRGILVKDSKILILGITFKENCPDIRNTKVIDLYKGFSEYTNNITVVDHNCDKNYTEKHLGITIETEIPIDKYDVVVLAVPHEKFLKMNFDGILSDNGFIFDMKSTLPKYMKTVKL